MNIGENIRRYRLSFELTQEQLAERVGVTMQAVSKWELGAALPDITLVTPIAEVFGVTPNDLFGYDKVKTSEELRYYYDEYRKHNASGDVEAKFAVMQEALTLHPHDWITRKLWCHAYTDAIDEEKMTPEEYKKGCDEIIRTYQSLVDFGAPDDDEKFDAMSMLLMWYRTLGCREEALALADRFPTMGRNREIELLCIYDNASGEFKQLLQEFIQYHTTQLAQIGILWSAWHKDDEVKIRIYEKFQAVLALIYDDGNYGFYHCYVSKCYKNMADAYLRLGKLDDALEHLRKSAKHAQSYDVLSEMHPYTAVLVDRLVHDRGFISRSHTGTECGQLLKALSKPQYNVLRRDNKLNEIISQLTA